MSHEDDRWLANPRTGTVKTANVLDRIFEQLQGAHRQAALTLHAARDAYEHADSAMKRAKEALALAETTYNVVGDATAAVYKAIHSGEPL
jgi:hypothetical protein